MSKKHLYQEVETPPGKTDYKSSLTKDTIAVKNGKLYQLVEVTTLNSYQNFLYHRALFGLSVYSQEEIKSMRKVKRQRIIKVHKRTQRLLNIWKQEEMIKRTNMLFASLFPKSPITKQLLKETHTDPELKCKLSFRDLEITKAKIIERLLAERILPNDFYSLKPDQP